MVHRLSGHLSWTVQSADMAPNGLLKCWLLSLNNCGRQHQFQHHLQYRHHSQPPSALCFRQRKTNQLITNYNWLYNFFQTCILNYFHESYNDHKICCTVECITCGSHHRITQDQTVINQRTENGTDKNKSVWENYAKIHNCYVFIGDLWMGTVVSSFVAQLKLLYVEPG